MLRRLIANQKFVVAVVYVSSMILNSLDSTIVNVSLATLGREFGVPASSIESVVIGYIVSLAVFMPASGWLGNRFGTRNVFLLALALFTLASVMCGFAQSLNQLVLFRVLQGAGGGLLTPVGMTLLYRTFPPAERLGVGRVLMFATILGPALGPVIGGGILEVASWRWTFWVKVPIAASALLFGWRFLHDERDEEPAGAFDWAGFALAGAGLGSTMFAVLEGPDMGWTSPEILATGIVGISCLVLLVRRALRIPAPIVDFRLYGNRLFLAINRVAFFGSAGFLGTLFLVPLYLQDARELSALTAGLTTMPEALGVVISTQVVARLYPHIGPRRLQASGLLLVTAAIAFLGMVQINTPLWQIGVNMFIIGVGMAFVFLPNQAASMATIERPKLGGASMLFSVQRQLGSAIGVALTSTVLSVVGVSVISGDVSAPNLDAYRAAFWAAAALSFIGSLWAWKVPDEDAAETMKR
ncbi:MAG TPA: DHA2 family efflux MFS transporter permease subunit [Thermomicrobiales bacterium]|nr:DHA2 family efflux MFS transporter permease subunit [Thermomicrobiales bacterium]